MTTEIKINCYIYCILWLFTYLIKCGNVHYFKFYINKNALLFNIYNYAIGTFILFYHNEHWTRLFIVWTMTDVSNIIIFTYYKLFSILDAYPKIAIWIENIICHVQYLSILLILIFEKLICIKWCPYCYKYKIFFIILL